jgi:hypothetical protein
MSGDMGDGGGRHRIGMIAETARMPAMAGC